VPDKVAQIAFGLSVGLVLYTYLGYPLLLLLLGVGAQAWADVRFAFFRGDRRRRLPAAEVRISLVFAAHNEEAVIEEKMRNCAALDYPPEHIEILVGCDGCTDRTGSLARAAAPSNARVLEFERSGKPEVLNRLVEQATGDVVVFSDANTMLDARAPTFLVRHFADPEIGCVCGDLRLTALPGASVSESFYWRYEGFLKFMESRLDLLLGANGGIYALRRELFVPIAKGVIIDDFLVAMQARRAGRRVIFDAEAFAREEAAPRVRDEYRRRVRIGAGNFHALRLTAGFLSPTAGRIAFSYWSHKVFRWLVPVALPVVLVSSFVLAAQHPVYLVVASLGVALLVLALLGRIGEGRGVHWPPLSVPYYFLSQNVALLVGLGRFLVGGQPVAWERTQRPDPATAHPGERSTGA
jgi:cellulose synthase/poly-beta-1,6-N-acetylglucosamine synthase-like glycosyltransferase